MTGTSLWIEEDVLLRKLLACKCRLKFLKSQMIAIMLGNNLYNLQEDILLMALRNELKNETERFTNEFIDAIKRGEIEID